MKVCNNIQLKHVINISFRRGNYLGIESKINNITYLQ